MLGKISAARYLLFAREMLAAIVDPVVKCLGTPLPPRHSQTRGLRSV